MRLAAALTLVVGVVSCGGGGEKAAPVAWCNNTGLLIYLLDQEADGGLNGGNGLNGSGG